MGLARQGATVVIGDVGDLAETSEPGAPLILKAAIGRGGAGSRTRARGMFPARCVAKFITGDWVGKSVTLDCAGVAEVFAAEARVGTNWTDNRRARQRRELKHRAPGETRTVPIHPALVTLLRDHLERYGTGPGGRVFIGPRGGILTDRAYLAVFHQARAAAFTGPEADPCWPAARTTCATPPCPTGSTPASRRRRSPTGPGTASTSCSGSTPSASLASKTRLSAASSKQPSRPIRDG